MTNDAFTRWDGVPFSDDVVLTVMLRSGKTITSKACDLDWSEDIVAYKILEKITPEDFGAAADPKGHPNAAILMDIAKEAAVNPEYWKEFQWHHDIDKIWHSCNTEESLLIAVYEVREFPNQIVRRKPRAIRIGNYDVPEYCKAWVNKSILGEGFIACFNFEKEECAELMLKALQELLGKK